MLRALMLLSAIFFVSTVARACELPEVVSASVFFNTESGSIALSEECNSETGVCKKYYIINPACETINYKISESKRSFNLTINTSGHCNDEGCEGFTSQEGYLAASVVYKHKKKTNILYPFEMIRGKGWMRSYNLSPSYRKKTSKGFYDLRKFENFFKLQADDAKLTNFDKEVYKLFHASTSSNGLHSWDNRKLFANSLLNAGFCNSPVYCTLKAYLFRFEETAVGMPSKPLRINGAIANSMGIAVDLRVPIRQGIYNSSFYINFQRQ